MALIHIPKDRVTFIIACVAIFAYINYTPPPKKISVSSQIKMQQDNIAASKKSEEKKYKVHLSHDKNNFFEKPINKLVDKINNTKTGHMIFNSFVKSAMQDQLGTSDIDIVEVNTTGKIKFKDIKTDSLEPYSTFCNDVVSIHYKVLLPDGATLLDTRLEGNQQPMTFVLDNTSMEGLAQSLLGMKKNNIRKVTAPIYMVEKDPYFNNKKIPMNTIVTYLVQLINLKPALAVKEDGIDIKELIKGQGAGPLCGQKVKIEYSEIKDSLMNGSTSSTRNIVKEVMFSLGETKKVPIGFEKAIIGLGTEGSRSVIIPSNLLSLDRSIKQEPSLGKKFEIKRLLLK